MQRTRSEYAGLALAGLVLLSGPRVSAQDEEKPTIAQKLKEVSQEYQTAYGDWMKKYQTAPEDKREGMIKDMPKTTRWFARLWKVVEATPEDPDVVDAAGWVLGAGPVSDSVLERVSKVLLAHHVDNEKITSFAATLGRLPSTKAADFLGKLEAKSAADEIKATACFQRAECLKSQAGMANMVASADEKTLAQLINYYGHEFADGLKKLDVDKIETAAEACYERILRTEAYAEVKHRGGSTLATVAKSNLFEMRNLAIGKPAPEITGEDIDGNPMRLTEYRGKVVVIDFWGDW